MRPRLAIWIVALLVSYAHGHADDASHDHTDHVQDLAQKEEEVAQELKVAANELSDLAKTETAPEVAAGLRGTSKEQAAIDKAEAAALEALAEEQYQIAETEMAEYFRAQEAKVGKMREESHEIVVAQAKENP
jgi:metal-dependent hydrolase (beta-lactamase superfamily II)